MTKKKVELEIKLNIFDYEAIGEVYPDLDKVVTKLFDVAGMAGIICNHDPDSPVYAPEDPIEWALFELESCQGDYKLHSPKFNTIEELAKWCTDNLDRYLNKYLSDSEDDEDLDSFLEPFWE